MEYYIVKYNSKKWGPFSYKEARKKCYEIAPIKPRINCATDIILEYKKQGIEIIPTSIEISSK